MLPLRKNKVSKLARGSRIASSLVVLSAIALVSGCAAAKRHHITVGSIPDDYRTNHPISVTESEQVFDIVVARNAHKPNEDQLKAVDGVISGYKQNGTGPLTVMLPLGSANEAAAGHVGAGIANHIAASGTANAGVNTVYYQSDGPEALAPVRVVYSALTASTGKCGRWPEDISNTNENKHYANFGCSYQNNLAAQIANPNDLNGPRAPGEIDATRRGNVIGIYRETETLFEPTIAY